MEFFIIKVNYLICKIILIIKQIKIKLTDFLLSPQCYFDYINSMRQLNVISLNINQIYYGVNNSQRQLISLFNYIFIWLSIIIILSLFKYYNYFICQFHLDHYINPVKPRIILLLNLLILTVIKTDFLIEKWKFNFRSFKFFYYLAYDLKEKHKLNDKKYKIFIVLTRFIKLVPKNVICYLSWVLSF